MVDNASDWHHTIVPRLCGYVLGINFSKAESADKREEAKKRMINAIIGIVVTLLFLILVKLFTANAGEIVKFVNGVA